MTSRDFAYWLQGFFELCDVSETVANTVLDAAQVETIKRHLALAFAHEIDPSAGNEDQQATLNKIHERIEATEKALASTQRVIAHGVEPPRYRC